MTRIADSSFLIALCDTDDARRVNALRIASEPDPIEIPPEVLGETLGVAHARGGMRAAVRIWEDLGRIPHLVYVQSTEIEHITAIFLKGSGKLSWVDAAVVAACQRENATPLCFDPDIEAAVRAG